MPGAENISLKDNAPLNRYCMARVRQAIVPGPHRRRQLPIESSLFASFNFFKTIYTSVAGTPAPNSLFRFLLFHSPLPESTPSDPALTQVFV